MQITTPYQRGRHIIIDLYGCNKKILNNLKQIENITIEAAKAAKVTILKTYFHPFTPCGISGMVLIAESHISIHTWPETAYAAVDIFTCGNSSLPEKASIHLIKKLEAKKNKRTLLERGNLI